MKLEVLGFNKPIADDVMKSGNIRSSDSKDRSDKSIKRWGLAQCTSTKVGLSEDITISGGRGEKTESSRENGSVLSVSFH